MYTVRKLDYLMQLRDRLKLAPSLAGPLGSLTPINPSVACSFLTDSVVAVGKPNAPDSKSTTWTNKFTYPIFIHKGFVWCGVSMGNRGDVSYILSDPRYIYNPNNDDHYEDRGGLPMNKDAFDVTPARFTLMPGESLTLALIANCDAGTPVCVAEAFACIYYVA